MMRLAAAMALLCVHGEYIPAQAQQAGSMAVATSVFSAPIQRGVLPAAADTRSLPIPIPVATFDAPPLRSLNANNIPSAAVTTFDVVAVSAYMRSGTLGAGTLLNPPKVGELAYLHITFQVTGTGAPTALTARAVLDGQTMCTANFGTVAVGGWVYSCPVAWKATSGSHTLTWDLDYPSPGIYDEPNEANNSASTTFSPSGANLEPTGVSLRTAANGGGSLLEAPSAGNTVFFTMDWQFNGTNGSGPVGARAMLDGVQFCSISPSAGAPSSNTSSCPAGWVVTGGNHTLQWDLDFAASIPEGNESDNSRSKFFVGGCSGGLAFTPTYDPAVSVAEQAVIQNALNFYTCTLTDPITIAIKFQRMASGLGQSQFSICSMSYSSFNAAHRADANPNSADDMLAFANGRLPVSATNPVTGAASQMLIKPANARAMGIVGCNSGLPGGVDGVISFNNSIVDVNGGPYSLLTTIQHEVDEILGLGSALPDFTANPWPEDLFRYGSTANLRNFAVTANCPGLTQAFFSIDGTAHINEFNNCSAGGDYGDWITHTPSQVQDAITNGSGSPYLTSGSDELRALDVIGYNLVSLAPHRHGQLTGD